MNDKYRIHNNTLGIIIGLVASIGWIFMGLDIGFSFDAPDAISLWLTLGGYRHTIVTLIALVLIPFCAIEKRWSFIAAMVLGAITLVLSVIHVLYMIIATLPGYETQLFGPVMWSVIQVVIIIFSYRAMKESQKIM